MLLSQVMGVLVFPREVLKHVSKLHILYIKGDPDDSRDEEIEDLALC